MAGAMDRRLKVYLGGVVLGCLLLTVMPRPFKIDRPRAAAEVAAADGAYPVRVRDGFGRAVQVDYPPRGIVSLAPSVTELIFALGLEARLLANTRYCTFPGRARSVAKIGRMDAPDLERILALGPDLVIGTVLSPPDLYPKLEGLGLNAIALEHKGFEGVLADIRTVGRLCGSPERAGALVARLRARRDALDAALAQLPEAPPPRVLLLYDLDDLTSAGSGSWVGDLIERCRAVNIAAGLPSAWPKLSLEAVLAENPDVLLLAAPPAAREAAEQRLAALAEHPVWGGVKAVKKGRAAVLDAALFQVPGPRMVLALEALARAIQPDLRAAE